MQLCGSTPCELRHCWDSKSLLLRSSDLNGKKKLDWDYLIMKFLCQYIIMQVDTTTHGSSTAK